MTLEQTDAAPIRAVHFVALGSVSSGLTRGLVVRVSRRLAVTCRLARSHVELSIPFLSDRNQVDADRLLANLEARHRAPEVSLVGLTALDLGNPIFTFFFGRARLNGRVSLVSIARLESSFYGLPENNGLTLTRATSEVLHELGHNAGLQHCKDHECLMHVAATVEGIDNRGSTCCAACASQLPYPLFQN